MLYTKKVSFILIIVTIFFIVFFISTCSSETTSNNQVEETQETSDDVNQIPEDTSVLGYGVLERLPGLWYGPVSSTTPAGSFDEWYVDFRPISKAQVSAYSELDIYTRNFMSFFIVKHDNEYKVAFRNGGGFKDEARIAYEVVDTVRETEDEAYYRFSDFQAGIKRVYTEMIFKGNKLTMQVFTSKYNTVDPAQLHMKWEAELTDSEAVKEAILHFNYPQKIIIKDFSTSFSNMSEAVYLSSENDPYDEASQPYLGEITVNITIDEELRIDPKKQIFILFTTQSLFEGIKYKIENIKYTSRYIYLDANTSRYTFKGMHPGKYYLYSFYDANDDKKFLSGDYMSSDPDNFLVVS